MTGSDSVPQSVAACEASATEGSNAPPPELPASPATGFASPLPSAPALATQVPGTPGLPAGPAAVQPQTTVNMPGMPRLVGAAEFVASAANDTPSWVWEGVLPEAGIVMIAGAPFSGKTVTMAVLMAGARDDGQLAGLRVLGSNFLYVKLEHNDRDFADLLEMARRGAGAHGLDNVHILKQLALDDDASLEYVSECADHVDAHVIVIDSLRRASTLDENSSQDAAEIMRRLQRLTNDGRRLVIVLHHLAKGTSATPRGSGDFLAGVDTFISMTKTADVVTLSAMHHSGGDRETRIRLVFNDQTVTAVAGGTGPHPGASSNEAQIAAAIIQLCSQQEYTRTGLRDAVRRSLGTGVRNDAIDGTADRLLMEGSLQNLGTAGRHRWRTVPAPTLPAGDPPRTA